MLGKWKWKIRSLDYFDTKFSQWKYKKKNVLPFHSPYIKMNNPKFSIKFKWYFKAFNFIHDVFTFTMTLSGHIKNFITNRRQSLGFHLVSRKITNTLWRTKQYHITFEPRLNTKNYDLWCVKLKKLLDNLEIV